MDEDRFLENDNIFFFLLKVVNFLEKSLKRVVMKSIITLVPYKRDHFEVLVQGTPKFRERGGRHLASVMKEHLALYPHISFHVGTVHD
jgi:hypothetical protein